MTTRMTPEAMNRSYEMSASLQERNALPEWMYSPPTPERPERLDPPDGKPPADVSVVVDCGGALYDRIVLYRLHEYEPPAVFAGAGPILSRFLHTWWTSFGREKDRPSTDALPENRERRAEILALATKCAAVGTSPAIERRRAWRVIDWKVRTQCAALLELAGWNDFASAFRALQPVVGPTLPRGTDSLFRSAERETDRASSAALKGQRPYQRRRDGRRWETGRTHTVVPDVISHRLTLAVRHAVPEIYLRHVRDDEVRRRERTPLGLAVLAASHSRICIDYDPRISDARVKRVLSEVEESARGLLDEIIAMGAGRAAAA